MAGSMARRILKVLDKGIKSASMSGEREEDMENSDLNSLFSHRTANILYSVLSYVRLARRDST